MKTRVILVDDHALTLIGMRYLLSAYDDLRIVAQAQDADGLLAQLEAHPCDLLITDLMMPGSQQADGLRLVQKVRRRYPDLPIIVVTMLGNPALVSSPAQAGHSRPGEQTRHARRSAQGDPPRRPSTIHLALHRTPAGSGRSRARQAAGQPRTTHPARSGSAAPVRQRPGGRGNRHPTVPQQADHQRAKSSAMRKLGLDSNAGLFIYIRENGLA
ncbi:response regulator [Pseudomonas aeruginosa]|nr:response regulator [Pseudomonas aeruginosa]